MISKNEMKQLYRDSYQVVCEYCAKPVITVQELSRDHRIPKSRGGITASWNMSWCHKKCNAEKGALTAEEYKMWKQLNGLRLRGEKIRE